MQPLYPVWLLDTQMRGLPKLRFSSYFCSLSCEKHCQQAHDGFSVLFLFLFFTAMALEVKVKQNTK